MLEQRRDVLADVLGVRTFAEASRRATCSAQECARQFLTGLQNAVSCRKIAYGGAHERDIRIGGGIKD